MESLFLIVADALIEERIYFLVDETLAHDEGCRLADVAGNPATAKSFGYSCCGAAATEEITNEVERILNEYNLYDHDRNTNVANSNQLVTVLEILKKIK